MEIFLCICGVLFTIFLIFRIFVRSYAWYMLISSWIKDKKTKRKKANFGTRATTYQKQAKKPKNIDETRFKTMEAVLELIKQFKMEHEGNFIGFTISGMKNNEVVPFKRADELFIKILYTGETVVSTWNYDDYEPFMKYKALFDMCKEENGDHSFCAKISIFDSDATTLLNETLPKAGFNKRVTENNKSLYCSLL